MGCKFKMETLVSMNLLSVLPYAFLIGFGWSAGCWCWSALLSLVRR